MRSLVSFWKNNGTKVLGTVIAINSGIAMGSVALPPPLNAHAATIIPWAVFVNFILGIVVLQRGNGNTNAIASQVVQQHVNAIAATNATNAAHGAVARAAAAPAPAPRPAPVQPVIAPAGHIK